MKRVYVVAGNHRQYEQYVREHAVQHVYVTRPEDLYGVELGPDDEVVSTGTYWKRRDWHFICDVIATLKRCRRQRSEVDSCS